jgi:putative intracellular protease/amidase
MQIVLLLFDGITALDAVGPHEVLSRIPGARVQFVAREAGIVETTEGALGLRATASLRDVRHADLLLVPGGRGTRRLVADEVVLDWVRAIDATSTWTTSVCTGALVLAAAGVLRGVRATTHWLAMDELARLGAVPVRERVVVEGKIATAAGVSAGIDLALTLAARICGDDVAQEIQLMLEYDPKPPFRAGSPEEAPPHIVARLRDARTRG